MFTVLAETKINHYENLFLPVCSSLTISTVIEGGKCYC